MKKQMICYHLLVCTLSCAWDTLSREMTPKDACPRCSACHAETKVNRWSEPQIAESRQRNTPSPAAHIQAAVYERYEASTPPEVRDRLERVLVFGGWETVDPYKNVSQERGTWIYTPIENSWFRIPMTDQPFDRFGHTLTTICRNTVVLYGGILNSKVGDGVHDWPFHVSKLPSPVSELWIFDGIREKWHKMVTEDNSPPPRSFHSAVAFGSRVNTSDTDTACSCQQSVIVFGGLTRDDKSKSTKLLNDLWELQCVDVGGEPKYRWRQHRTQPVWPEERYLHFAVNVNNSTMLMFGGGGRKHKTTNSTDKYLWSLNVSSKSWKQENYSKLEERHNEAESLEWPIAAFALDRFGNGNLQIQSGQVFSFRHNPISWIQENVFVGSSTPVNLRDFAAVTVNGTVFVFAGIEQHTSFQSMRVWTVEQINSSWIWQLRSPPRTSPPLQALASWNVIGDRLIFAASTSHEWATFLCHKWSRFVDIVRQTAAVMHKSSNGQMRESVKSLTNVFDSLRKGLNVSINSVWQMDIETHTWWQYPTASDNRPLFYTASEGIALGESKILVTYGGSSVSEFETLRSSPSESPFSLAFDKSEVFLYFFEERRWMKPELVDIGRKPKARVFATLSHVGDGRSMILFGGAVVKSKTVDKMLNSSTPLESVYSLYAHARRKMENDVWKLSLSSNRNSSLSDQITIEWTQLTEHSSNSTVPAGRLGHRAVVVGNMFVIWGGLQFPDDQLFACANELWVLHLDNLTWTKHDDHIGAVSGCWNPSDLCRGPATVLGSTIVTIQQETLGSKTETSCNRPRFLSMLVNETNCQLRSPDHVHPFPFRPEFMFAWRDEVLAVKQKLGDSDQEQRSDLSLSLQYQDRIYTSRMTPGCDSGFYSPDWGMELCRACGGDSYASPGARNCTQCPKGLSTHNTPAASRHDCICDPGYCRHGRCFIAHTREQPSAECKCDFGFTGAQCQQPTYFIIAAVSIASLIIFLLLLVFVRKMMKYKKQKAAKETQLEEMARVWTIKHSEIILLHRIDDGAPGSYGDVYKARYRDMTVALKKLKLRTREFEREFQRETQLMKSMRHENIVLFLGAGTFGSDDCPFLVVEHMQNGALSSILCNPERTITREHEMNFCLDAANGMKFLHSQRPPRIHRDLKSSNLLVSARWVIKVADFGSARLVKRLGGSQSVVKRKTRATTIRDTAAEPLLKAEGALSDSVGSALWRAPEIFADEPYGTPVDVYSFGIVMWEIVARDLPYRDKGYRWVTEIKEAVLTGVRPTLPNSVLKSYRDLMMECWSGNPSRRPAFTEVVQRLTRMPLQNYMEGRTLVVGSAP